jgi:hypothetical protein
LISDLGTTRSRELTSLNVSKPIHDRAIGGSSALVGFWAKRDTASRIVGWAHHVDALAVFNAALIGASIEEHR